MIEKNPDETTINTESNIDIKQMQERGLLGSVIGGLVLGPVGAVIGDKIQDAISGDDEEDKKEEDEQQKPQKKKGGSCSGNSSSDSDSSSDSADSDSENNDSSKETSGDNPDKNTMCKKTFTVYREIEKEYSCPTAHRDNLSDQFTPQDDLIHMEKMVRDFLKLEGKIYDPETLNPRFFASEDWVQSYEKDKNIILATMDQFKANILRMEHLYTVVDNNSYGKLLTIPNQDCKSSYQTNILWTSRALKDWGNNWFIKRNSYSNTELFKEDHWMPGLTGQMIQWMKLGTYKEYKGVSQVGIETMIEKVEKLEAVIDRLMNKDAVQETISKYVGLKEELEQKADQKQDRTFTSSIIDSQMGKKLGVVDTGIENNKIEGTTYKKPKEDDVEKVILKCKLSCVKTLFQKLREKSMEQLKSCRCVSQSGPGSYPDIWANIDVFANPVYTDLDILNELIEDKYNDFESPGKHCSITHQKLCPIELRKRITSFKTIIQQGVTDVMTNTAMLPKNGLNILDSMFNQMWEYGEKGPIVEMPSWCQEAINSIDAFERSMMDAWSEVYDCWEREFITRLWNVELDHHTSNYERTQTKYVKTMHNHQHPFVPLTMMTLASIGGDTKFSEITPLKGVLTCPGHLEKLMKPVCIQYRIFNIAHLARNYRSDIKNLCQWMTAAIQAIGIKQATISAVMSDPSLNGECGNKEYLKKINDLRDKNFKLLEKVEKAYAIYSDIDNLKNKKDWDDEIALQELQPSKYSNEDQLNMTSSVQTESNQKDFSAELCQGGIDIGELKPWNHLSLSENKKKAKCIPVKCVCNKFEKVIKSLANFETEMNLEG